MGLAACFFTTIAWSLASGFYKRASLEADIFQINLIRCALGCVLCYATAWLLLPSMSAHRTGEEWVFLVLSAITSRVLGDSLFLRASQLMGHAPAMSLGSLYPLWATLGGMAVGKETATALEFLGMSVTLGGVLLVVQSRDKGHQAHRPSRFRWLGLFWAFAASLTWALSLVFVRWGAQNMDAFLASGIRMGVASLAIIPILLLSRRPLIPQSASAIKLTSAGGALEAYLGTVAFVYGVTHTTMAVGATLTSLGPIFNIPVSVLYLKEQITWPMALGILITTLGVVILVTA